MTLSLSNRNTPMRLVELAVVLVLAHYFSTWVADAAAALHMPLPEMPLLKHVYLFFSFILLVCLWIRLRGETFSDFGLIVPTHWWRYIGQGFLLFVVAILWDVVARPMIDPLIAHATGTSPTLAEQHFASVRGNLGLTLYLVAMGWISGGFGEEMLYRGFIMTRIAQVLGSGRWAWIAAVFLQAIPFALGHSYQGPVGMTGVFVSALITGAGTIIWGRNLWPAIIAHGLQDTLGFVALYFGLAHG
jgi:membrane protease YdiL (CAAX protease family)